MMSQHYRRAKRSRSSALPRSPRCSARSRCGKLAAPRRKSGANPSVGARWPHNLGLLFVDSRGAAACSLRARRSASPWLARSAAGACSTRRPTAWWLVLPLAVVPSTSSIYLQHVMFHAVPRSWRLHRVHHADLDFDVTTGVRFHPVEILLSMVIKMAAVVAARRAALSRCCSSRCCSTPRRCSTTATSACRGWLDRCCAGWWSRRRCTGSTTRSLPRRDEQQLRLQPAVVGPPVRHLPGPAEAGHEAMTIGIDAFRSP